MKPEISTFSSYSKKQQQEYLRAQVIAKKLLARRIPIPQVKGKVGAIMRRYKEIQEAPVNVEYLKSLEKTTPTTTPTNVLKSNYSLFQSYQPTNIPLFGNLSIISPSKTKKRKLTWY